MSNVTITAYFKDDNLSKSYVDAVSQLLSGMEMDVEHKVVGDVSLVIAQQKDTPSPAALIDPPVELPPEMPLTDPTEITVALAAPDIVAAAVPVTGSGAVIVKNLSTSCAIPYSVDVTLKHTELKVKKLSKQDEHVSFIYCDMSYKFPIAKDEEKVDNKEPQYTDTSIRATIEIGKESNLIHALLKLVETDDSSCIMFGQDLADHISIATEKTDGTIST